MPETASRPRALPMGDPLWTALSNLKYKVERLLLAIETYNQDDPAISKAILLPLGQLSYATDNMMRLHLLNTVKPTMVQIFGARIAHMGTQCTQLQRSIQEALPDKKFRVFCTVHNGTKVSQQVLHAGLQAQLAQDFDMNLVVTAKYVQATPMVKSAE